MFAPRLTVLPPRCAGVVGPIAPISRFLCYCRRLSPVSMEVRLQWLVHRARSLINDPASFCPEGAMVALVSFAGVPVIVGWFFLRPFLRCRGTWQLLSLHPFGF